MVLGGAQKQHWRYGWAKEAKASYANSRVPKVRLLLMHYMYTALPQGDITRYVSLDISHELYVTIRHFQA